VRVLVIPEDRTLDQYILKPIIVDLFADLGVPAVVEVLPRPHLQGIEQVLVKVDEIIDTNRMVDLFLLIVDRDCRDGRATQVGLLEARHPDKLIACLAIEEVEVWMLALHRQDLGVSWREVRAECHPKERFAEPFLVERGWNMSLGRGRERAMRALSAQWRGLMSVCEELAKLRERIADHLRRRA
jgi:hypothetical protein